MGDINLEVGRFQRLQNYGGDDTGLNSAQVGVEGQYTGCRHRVKDRIYRDGGYVSQSGLFLPL